MEGGKQRKEGKGGRKASRASTPATDAGASGEEAEDRWDFECIECGQEGDPLLCCEVRVLTRRLVMCPDVVTAKDSSSAERACSLLALLIVGFQATWHAPSFTICPALPQCKLCVMDVQNASIWKCALGVDRPSYWQQHGVRGQNMCAAAVP